MKLAVLDYPKKAKKTSPFVSRNAARRCLRRMTWSLVPDA